MESSGRSASTAQSTLLVYSLRATLEIDKKRQTDRKIERNVARGKKGLRTVPTTISLELSESDVFALGYSQCKEASPVIPLFLFLLHLFNLMLFRISRPCLLTPGGISLFFAHLRELAHRGGLESILLATCESEAQASDA